MPHCVQYGRIAHTYIHTWYETKIGMDYLVPLHTYTS